MDLSKAFDTVDHDILLLNLEHGIRGTALRWFENYLNNRQQYVEFNASHRSELWRVKCGVPQGSMLGLLLFLVYINDLCNVHVSKVVDFILDTNIFIPTKILIYFLKP